MRKPSFKLSIENLIFLVNSIRKSAFKKNERNNFKEIHIACVTDGEKSCLNPDSHPESFAHWASDYTTEPVRLDT